VVTTLANSSDPPMIIIGITAAEKIAVNPSTEYQAAIAERHRATNSVKVAKLNSFLRKIMYYLVVFFTLEQMTIGSAKLFKR